MNCTHYVQENTCWTRTDLKKCVICNRRRLYAKKMVRCSVCGAFVHKRCLSGKINDGVVFSTADVADEAFDVFETIEIDETVSAVAVNSEKEDCDQVLPENGDRDSVGIGALSRTTVSQEVVLSIDESSGTPATTDRIAGDCAFVISIDGDPEIEHVQSLPTIVVETDGELVMAVEDREIPSEPKCSTDEIIGIEIPNEMIGTVQKTCCKIHLLAGADRNDDDTSSSFPSTTSDRKSAAAKRRAKKTVSAAKITTSLPVPVDHLISTNADICRVTDKIAPSPVVSGVDRISYPIAGSVTEKIVEIVEIDSALQTAEIKIPLVTTVAAITTKISDDKAIGTVTGTLLAPTIIPGRKNAATKRRAKKKAVKKKRLTTIFSND